MSYATALKQEMCRQEPQKLCCRKAHINGFLFCNASCHQKDIEVILSGTAVCDYFSHLIENAYRLTPRRTMCRGGGETSRFCFSSSSASKFLSDIENHILADTISVKCDDCRKYFLRGVFLACGTPSDPANAFRVDFTPRYHAAELAAYLTASGLKPLATCRRGRTLLYYRSGEKIGDLFATMGQNDAYFALQNEYLKRELNNLTNRQNNCTVSNIGRSIERGSELVLLLRRMREENKLSLLPEELKTTAELRLAYPDYTLHQLAAVSVPPLSKSGLNHRLKRISEIARKHNM